MNLAPLNLEVMSPQLIVGMARAHAMGIHSNIPKCCVEYFCRVWLPFLQDAPDWSVVPDFHRQFGDRWQYWPCPECQVSGYSQPLHVCIKRGPNKCPSTDQLLKGLGLL